MNQHLQLNPLGKKCLRMRIPCYNDHQISRTVMWKLSMDSPGNCFTWCVHQIQFISGEKYLGSAFAAFFIIVIISMYNVLKLLEKLAHLGSAIIHQHGTFVCTVLDLHSKNHVFISIPRAI